MVKRMTIYTTKKWRLSSFMFYVQKLIQSNKSMGYSKKGFPGLFG